MRESKTTEIRAAPQLSVSQSWGRLTKQTVQTSQQRQTDCRTDWDLYIHRHLCGDLSGQAAVHHHLPFPFRLSTSFNQLLPNRRRIRSPPCYWETTCKYVDNCPWGISVGGLVCFNCPSLLFLHLAACFKPWLPIYKGLSPTKDGTLDSLLTSQRKPKVSVSSSHTVEAKTRACSSSPTSQINNDWATSVKSLSLRQHFLLLLHYQIIKSFCLYEHGCFFLDMLTHSQH